MADRVRDLRRTDAARNETQIKALTVSQRAKWDDLRALRAGPANGDAGSRGRGGLYG